MTPRYQWTPASEPPDTARLVIIWRYDYWDVAFYWSSKGGWRNENGPIRGVICWRDVEPPGAGK